MKHAKGCCLKCGTRILEGRKALPNYKCLGYNQEDGNVILIGFCSNCKLEPSEYSAALNALNAEHIEKFKFKSPIVSFEKEHTKEFPKANLICSRCKEQIEGSYVYNVGDYYHEVCEEPKYKKIVEKKAPLLKVKKEEKVKRGRKSETELPS